MDLQGYSSGKVFATLKVVLGDPWELRTKQWHQSIPDVKSAIYDTVFVKDIPPENVTY